MTSVELAAAAKARTLLVWRPTVGWPTVVRVLHGGLNWWTCSVVSTGHHFTTGSTHLRLATAEDLLVLS